MASLQRELTVLQPRLEELKRGVIAHELINTREAPLIRARRDRLAKRMSRIERRIAVLRDEPEEVTMATDYDEELLNGNGSVEVLIAERSVTDPDAMTVREIKEHARLCDEHAAALAVNIKALHTKITALRMKRGGRGPSSIVVPSALERAAAKHFTGTVLRSIRGPVPRPGMGGFKEQVELWMPSLTPPKKNVAA
jgi:hypothetical protein